MLGPTGMVVGPVLIPLADTTTSSTTATATATATAKSEVPTAAVADSTSASGTSSSVEPNSLTSSRADAQSQGGRESRPSSSELSAQAHNRKPFLDKMMTQTNLLVLPPSNPSYQMAYFLKTTGPVEEAPKATRHRRISSAMRLFRTNNRRPSESLAAAHQRLNDVLAEETTPDSVGSGVVEPKLPGGVVQKVSKTGKKYFQIEPTVASQDIGDPQSNRPDILESRVSVFLDEQDSGENLSDWILSLGGHVQGYEVPAGEKITSDQMTTADCSVRILNMQDSTPIRPPASAPATPAPDSGIDVGSDDHNEDSEDKVAPLRSHPIMADISSRNLPLIAIKSAPTSQYAALKMPQLAHPSPRRVGSHSLLLQRTTSDVTGLRYSQSPAVEVGRSVSDNQSPGPPPPRSPLRASVYSQQIDDVLIKPQGHQARPTVKAQPDRHLQEWQKATETSKDAAITALPQFERHGAPSPDFGKPALTRRNVSASVDVFAASNFRSRDSKHAKSTNVADVTLRSSQPDMLRRRLRRSRPDGPRSQEVAKARPQTSSAHLSETACAGPLPINCTPPMIELSENIRAVPASQTSSPKVGYVRRPTNAFLRGRKSPAPRPRSGKVARSQARSTHSGSRPSSPARSIERQMTPPLPSPPPKKELPPRPVVSTQRKTQHNRGETSIDATLTRACSTKALPSPPVYEQGRSLEFLSPPSSIKNAATKRAVPIESDEVSSTSSRSVAYKYPAGHMDQELSSRLEERLAAIERRNRLLEAALMAVLKTSGTLNGCPCGLESATSSAGAQSQHAHHQTPDSDGSGMNSDSPVRDVLDLFKETKVGY